MLELDQVLCSLNLALVRLDVPAAATLGLLLRPLLCS